MPFLITAELFKQSHRPAAYTVAGCLNWLSNFTIGFVFPFLEVRAKSHSAFLYVKSRLFYTQVIVVVFLLIFSLPETTKMKSKSWLASRFNSKRKSFMSKGFVAQVHLDFASRLCCGPTRTVRHMRIMIWAVWFCVNRGDSPNPNKITN